MILFQKLNKVILTPYRCGSNSTRAYCRPLGGISVGGAHHNDWSYHTPFFLYSHYCYYNFRDELRSGPQPRVQFGVLVRNPYYRALSIWRKNFNHLTFYEFLNEIESRTDWITYSITSWLGSQFRGLPYLQPIYLEDLKNDLDSFLGVEGKYEVQHLSPTPKEDQYPEPTKDEVLRLQKLWEEDWINFHYEFLHY